MDNEIKRNAWSKFCKKFSSVNQYRQTELQIQAKEKETASVSVTPFMGVALAKKGRFIDGIQFFAGRGDADKIVEPILTIKEPTKIVLEKDKTGRDNRLHVRSKDGTVASLNLHGEKKTDQARSLVEQIAYSMYERRGYAVGNDMGDWLTAEQKVKEAELHLTE